MAALGTTGDARGPLTVTGGSPHGEGYTTHAIATMTDHLRHGAPRRPGGTTGAGWFLVNYLGIWGPTPPPGEFQGPRGP